MNKGKKGIILSVLIVFLMLVVSVNVMAAGSAEEEKVSKDSVARVLPGPIVGHGFIFVDQVLKVAPEFPDSNFFVTAGLPPGPSNIPSNVSFMQYRSEEGFYLAGMLAGKKTESNTIGYVGAQETPICLADLAAYKMGAREVNPDGVKDFDFRSSSINVQARTLSGGNLQKLILAREVSKRTPVLIAMQPTRGVDLATMKFIHRRLIELRGEGAGILLISTELDEIFALSDRIAVIYEGEIMGIRETATTNRETVGLLMGGMKKNG